MIELLGPLLGAGASIAGGIMGANAQDKAADQNWKTNLLNYYQRERERNDRMTEAKTARKERNEGVTDATGSRTHYVAGKGWVTDLSDDAKNISDLQRNEQERVLNQDLPEKRAQQFRNIARMKNEGMLADATLKEARQPSELPGDAGRRYAALAATETNGQYDDLVNSAMRKAVRTGSTNTGSIIAALAKQRASANAGAGVQAYMAGEDSATKAATDKRSQLMNLYNMLATRASGKVDANYTPDPVNANSTNLMMRAAARGDSGQDQVIGAAGMKGGDIDYIEPNMGWANAITSGGQAAASSFGNISSRMRSGQKPLNFGPGNTGDLW